MIRVQDLAPLFDSSLPHHVSSNGWNRGENGVPMEVCSSRFCCRATVALAARPSGGRNRTWSGFATTWSGFGFGFGFGFATTWSGSQQLLVRGFCGFVATRGFCEFVAMILAEEWGYRASAWFNRCWVDRLRARRLREDGLFLVIRPTKGKFCSVSLIFFFCKFPLEYREFFFFWYAPPWFPSRRSPLSFDWMKEFLFSLFSLMFGCGRIYRSGFGGGCLWCRWIGSGMHGLCRGWFRVAGIH